MNSRRGFSLTVVCLILSAATFGQTKPGTTTPYPAARGVPSQATLQPPQILKDGSFPGEVRVFADEACPMGWLAADGQSYNDTDYPLLPAAIGDLWGSPKPNTFRVPDLRGIFLRGWNAEGQGNRADKYADTDADKRELPQAPEGPPNNPDTNHVGAYQEDAIQAHQHNDAGHANDMGFTYQNSFAYGNACGALTVSASGGNLTHTSHAVIGDPTSSPTGSSVKAASQTGPVNAYEQFCIGSGK